MDELGVVNQMYLYATSSAGFTNDVKCAFLVELSESLMEIIQSEDIKLQKYPNENGKLKPCLRTIINCYGKTLFRNEIEFDLEKILSCLVNTRVNIMHIKINQRKPALDGRESVLYAVTIATRGKTPDSYGDKVERITIQRTNEESMREALQGKHFDVVIDKIAYCSNDIRYVMDYVDCDKYIYMSSTSVYNPKHMNTVESDFDGYSKDFVWCDRKEFPYEQIKRQAEYALWQKYPGKNWIAVRYPFAIGKDDYTKRLLFYVEHVIKSEPMYIDNIDYQMSYIRSDEAGEFIAYLVDKDVKGAINGSASETISLREVINYIEEKTGKCAALSEQGEAAPYNGEPEYSINTDKAEKTGYRFSNLKDWIYELLDYYIEQVDKAECKEE